jgi:hypothetical protein
VTEKLGRGGGGPPGGPPAGACASASVQVDRTAIPENETRCMLFILNFLLVRPH